MASPATTPNKYTVVLHYAAPEYLNITTIAGSVLIVNKAQWSKIQGPGDGRRDQGNWYRPLRGEQLLVPAGQVHGEPALLGWRTPPAPEVNVAYYATNTAAATALADGQLTWAGNDIANVDSIFVNKDPKTNHTYFAPGSTVTLWFNTTGTGPLSDPAVRQAISYGIDRTALSVKGESGYENPATSSSGLILPSQSAFLEPSLKNDLPATQDPTTSWLEVPGTPPSVPMPGAPSISVGAG